MINWKKSLGMTVLSAGLVFSSFAPISFAKTSTSQPLIMQKFIKKQTNSDTAKLPFLDQHSGGPFDMGLVNEDKILKLLIKQGIVSKNASKRVKELQMQAYFAKRSDKAAALGTNQQEMKKVRTNMQKKAGLSLKPAGVPKAESTTKSNVIANNSSVVGPLKKDSWTGTERKDKVLVLLIEYPDAPHNQITAADNPVLLYSNYSRQHYQDMIFGNNGYTGPNGQKFLSVKQYYEQQSGGSYTIDGQVSDWYQASQPAAYYGANDPLYGSDQNPRALVQEALAHAAQDPSINLKDYDKEDPFDLNSNGIYNEPDGIIDHLMVVHSGVGEEAGGGSLGADAIWSHSWDLGEPTAIPNSQADVPYWGGQMAGYAYTIQPEDGASGVFAHEFGHNLGLPDEYDTGYTHGGVGAPTGAWTIMSQGSWAGKLPGTEPTGFSPYDKNYLQSTMPTLNWFKDVEYNLNDLKNGKNVKLDEASVKGTNADGVKIKLPDKSTTVNKPASGQYEYFSGSGNNLFNGMFTTVNLSGKTSAQITFKTWYNIEKDFDYAYVAVSTDGQNFITVPGDITTNDNPYGQNEGNGITGNSNGWRDATFDLSAFAGQPIYVIFAYATDPGVALPGFYVDDIQLTADGNSVLSDDAEGTNSPFMLAGFEKNNGITMTSQYYLLEWRNYAAADVGLAHLAEGNSLLSYDPGLVVWYVDNKYTDNWVGDHPGDGFLGVVDAHQETANWKDSNPYDGYDEYGPAGTFEQIQDSAFSLNKTDKTYLDYRDLFGTYLSLNSQPAATVFDDSRDYSNAGQIYAGRDIPKFGLKIHVTGQASDMSVGAIELHTGTDHSVQLNPLSKTVYSNQKGFNQVSVSGIVDDDGTGESLKVKYEILNSKAKAITSYSQTLTGLYQSVAHTLTLPSKTPTGNYYVKVTATDESGKSISKQLAFKVDNDAPTVTVNHNGSTTPAKSAAVKVTVNGAVSSTLGYDWSQSSAAPATGWKTFKSGSTLTLSGKKGKWYLHVRAKDSVGNSVNWNSKSFSLK